MNENTSQNATIHEPEAARYIGLSVAWLRQSRMRGRGPAFVRIGRAIRYRLADLEAYLSAHRIEPRDRHYTDADSYYAVGGGEAGPARVAR